MKIGDMELLVLLKLLRIMTLIAVAMSGSSGAYTVSVLAGDI